MLSAWVCVPFKRLPAARRPRSPEVAGLLDNALAGTGWTENSYNNGATFREGHVLGIAVLTPVSQDEPWTLQQRWAFDFFDQQAVVSWKCIFRACLAAPQPAALLGAEYRPRTTVCALSPGCVQQLLHSRTVEGATVSEFLQGIGVDCNPVRLDTCIQVYPPLALALAYGLWNDLSLPASARWASVCHGFEHRQLAEQRFIPMYPQHDFLDSITLRGIANVFREIGQARSAASPGRVGEWGDLMADARSCIIQLESCAAFLDGRSYNNEKRSGELMLRVIKMAADARSTHRLRTALMNSLAVMFYQISDPHQLALAKLVSADLPLPAQGTVVQWRFVFDALFMLHMRRENADLGLCTLPVEDLGGMLYIAADSSPQGGTNWLMTESFYVNGADVLSLHKTLPELIRLALHMNEQGNVLPEDCSFMCNSGNTTALSTPAPSQRDKAQATPSARSILSPHPRRPPSRSTHPHSLPHPPPAQQPILI